MFGVSIPEILVILVIILLVLGPEKLPSTAQKVGNFLGMIRKQTDAVRRDFYNSLYPPAEEIKQSLQEAKRDLRAVAKELGGEEFLTCEQKAQLEQERQEKKESEDEQSDEESTEKFS